MDPCLDLGINLGILCTYSVSFLLSAYFAQLGGPKFYLLSIFSIINFLQMPIFQLHIFNRQSSLIQIPFDCNVANKRELTLVFLPPFPQKVPYNVIDLLMNKDWGKKNLIEEKRHRKDKFFNESQSSYRINPIQAPIWYSLGDIMHYFLLVPFPIFSVEIRTPKYLNVSQTLEP